MDGDGDVDVLSTAATTADAVAWWENTAGDGSTWTKHTIESSFDGGVAVFAADVDGDGDIDALAAARDDDDIAWWENDNGAGTAWTRRTIAGAFDGAYSIIAADLDGDGDTDFLGAASLADDIAWWENNNGEGTSRTKYTIDGNYDKVEGISVADVDGDGDIDVLAVGGDDEVSWWENRGGQFGLPTTDTAAALVPAGDLVEVLKVTATHNGRTGDNPVELVTFDLLLEETAGDPMSDEEANGRIESLRFYRDDDEGAGAGSFQLAEDSEVASISTLSLTEGVQTVTFADGDADVEVEFGTDRCYFVVAELTVGGPFVSFRITHQTENTSTGEDADYDVPLRLAFSTNTTATVLVNEPPIADAGPDQLLQVVLGGTADVTLDGSGSVDPNMGALTYTWTGSFPEGSGTVTGAMPMVTLGPGVHTVTLEVDDGTGLTDTDTVDITVNQPPVSNAGPDQPVQVAAGDSATVTLDGSGSSDPDTNPLTYTWMGPFPEGGGTVMGEMSMVTLGGGVSTVTLEVDDGNGGMDTDTVDITVELFCPTTLTLSDQTLSGTQTLEATVSATLGPNLIIDGTDIAVNAPTVSILNGTEIGGIFTVGLNPSCP